jgi:hypothetical protein
MLMLSVYKIRKFYKENKLTEELNSKAMLLHVMAFAGYVLSLIILYPLTVLTLLNPQNQEVYKAFEISFGPLTFTATVAQILLCVIFWQFGGKL